MDSRFEKTDRILKKACEERRIPGAVFLAGQNGETLFLRVYGCASWEPEVTPMTVDTRFDLASLTKVTATWPCIARLMESGKLTLDTTLPDMLPWDFPVEMRGITLMHLLTHTAGLLEDMDLDGFGGTREERVRGIMRIPLQYPVGESVHYSDLGFMLLGEIVSFMYGKPLDQAARDVWQDLGMEHTMYCPPGNVPFAATEKVNGVVTCGFVHDERAQQLFGVAGHAGVFSTAEDLGIYCANLIPGRGSRICGDDTLRLSFRLWKKDPKWDRGLGFVVYREQTGGNLIGHTGFTGTSMKVNTENGLYHVLLTNRVHPTRENSQLGPIRDEIDHILYD